MWLLDLVSVSLPLLFWPDQSERDSDHAVCTSAGTTVMIFRYFPQFTTTEKFSSCLETMFVARRACCHFEECIEVDLMFLLVCSQAEESDGEDRHKELLHPWTWALPSSERKDNALCACFQDDFHNIASITVTVLMRIISAKLTDCTFSLVYINSCVDV
jgi:hypothetical protein